MEGPVDPSRRIRVRIESILGHVVRGGEKPQQQLYYLDYQEQGQLPLALHSEQGQLRCYQEQTKAEKTDYRGGKV